MEKELLLSHAGLCGESQDSFWGHVTFPIPLELSGNVEGVPVPNFFPMPKSFIGVNDSFGPWCSLKPNAKSVYPAIVKHCNKHGKCNPSNDLLAELCGISRQSVTSAIQGLQGFGMLEYRLSPNFNRGTFHNVYRCLRGVDDNSLFLFSNIVNSGVWKGLKQRAQSLYVVMRRFSGLSAIDIANILHEMSSCGLLSDGQYMQGHDIMADFKKYLLFREYEVTAAKAEMLQMASGIKTRKTLLSALGDLMEMRLIAPIKLDCIDWKGWRVQTQGPM